MAYYFTEEFLSALRARCDIETVVSRYVTLKASGANKFGLCPFHNERTPSFSVNSSKELFKCFGCGASGDVISFIMRIENLSYVDAVVFLANSVGMDIPVRQEAGNQTKELRKKILEMNKVAAKYFHDVLLSDEGRPGREYFTQRRLTKKTITHFGLGFSPDSWDSLLKHLQKEGFSLNDIKASGLVTNKEGHTYDAFRGRVMFPIIDQRYNVIGFGARTIKSDEKTAKYINTGETVAFSKKNNLFGLNFAKDNASQGLILCEGYMDVIALHQAGITNAVAPLGTAFTDSQARLINRYTKNVILCFDSDNAGKAATARALTITASVGLTAKVFNVPDGKDPDEFIKKNGADAFLKLINQSENSVDYKINEAKRKYNLNILEEKVECMREIVAILAQIRDKIEMELYVNKVSKDMDVTPESINAEIKSYIIKQQRKRKEDEARKTMNDYIAPYDRINRQRSANRKAAQAEDMILTILINKPEMLDTINQHIDESDFATDFNRKIFMILKNKIPENVLTEPINILSAELEPEEMDAIAKMVKDAGSLSIDKEKTVSVCKKLKEEKDKTYTLDLKNLSDEELERVLKSKKNKQ